MNNEEKYYVYIYYKENIVMYVGQTIAPYERYMQHLKEDDVFKEVNTVKILECNSRIDMDIIEMYYINKLRPLLNICYKNRGIPDMISIDDKSIQKYNLEEFKKTFKKKNKPRRQPKNILQYNNSNERLLIKGYDIVELDNPIIDIFSEDILEYDLNKTAFKYKNNTLYFGDDYFNKNEITGLSINEKIKFIREFITGNKSESINNYMCHFLNYTIESDNRSEWKFGCLITNIVRNKHHEISKIYFNDECNYIDGRLEFKII